MRGWGNYDGAGARGGGAVLSTFRAHKFYVVVPGTESLEGAAVGTSKNLSEQCASQNIYS